MISSLLRQFLEQSGDLPPYIYKIYEGANPSDQQTSTQRSRPLYSTLIEAITECTKQFNSLFFMLDAFDECSQTQQEFVLKFIQDFYPNARIHILVSTRTHIVSKLHNLGCDNAKIEARGNKEDITRFVTESLKSRSLQESLVQSIADKVAETDMFVLSNYVLT